MGDHPTAVETYVPHSAPNEIFMALRRRSDDARRGTADDLQGPSRRQALTILHTSICDKAGHCDFTGRMLTSPLRPGPETSRPGPARWLFKIIEPGPARVGQGSILHSAANSPLQPSFTTTQKNIFTLNHIVIHRNNINIARTVMTDVNSRANAVHVPRYSMR